MGDRTKRRYRAAHHPLKIPYLRASERRSLALMSILMIGLFFLPAFSLASDLNSGDEDKDPTKISDLWDELKEGFDYSLRFLTFGTYQDVAASTQNPDNDFFQIPRYQADLELRPDAQLNFRRLELSVKPRMSLEWMAWEDGTRKGDDNWEVDWFVNEWLARIRIIESLFASYGRENLQWGPSYLISPSNPFFADNGRSNPKQEVPGMGFARLVWLPEMTWSVSLIANLDKGRQEFETGSFDKVYALKLDYSGQESYAGVIFSHKERNRNRLGFFGGWTATDALLLYGEGTLSRGTSALYPVAVDTHPFGATMQATDEDDSSLKGILLAGGSYTLESGPTVMVEYLYNSPGYSDDQANTYYSLRKNASAESTGSLLGLSRMTLGQTADPGLRFLRQNYAMFQYSHNDIVDVLNLLFRWTWNMDDGSGQFISIVEYFVGDNIQLFSIGTVNSGNGDREFGSILDSQWMTGLEYTF